MTPQESKMLTEETTYINIQSWMVQKLKLKSNELIIYALIHGFCQDGKSYFYGSIQYIIDHTNLSKEGVLTVLQNLVRKKLIVKKDVQNITVFDSVKKAQGNQHFCLYYTKVSRSKKQDEPVRISDPQIQIPSQSPVRISDPAGQKNTPVPVRISDRTGQENTPEPVRISDPISYSYITILKAAVANLDDLFGQDAFTKNFYQTAAEFLLKNQLNVKEYCLFVYELTLAKSPIRPKGLFYKLFLQNDIVSDFQAQQEQKNQEVLALQQEQKRIEESKIICPVCTKYILPESDACPYCKTPIIDFSNEDIVKKQKNYIKLSSAEKTAYDDERARIMFKYSHPPYTAQERSRQKELLTQLDLKYKLITDKEVS